jgi:hypothetical protein
MVLVADKPSNDISILQTKFSDREGHETRCGGLEAMPLDQHVKCRHSERESRVEIRPAPMHHLLHMALRHEVAKLIVWHVVSTRPVVPSTVSYEDVREGNAPYRALGHGTHSHPTGTRTVRGRCICQHQAETGLDGWYGEQM